MKGRMKTPFYGLAVLLLCGQLSLAQEPNKEKPKDLTPPGSKGMVMVTAEEVAGLRLDLLLQKKIALQLKLDLSAADQKLLKAELDAWEGERTALQQKLDGIFGCKYDLDKRACEPEPKKPKPEKELTP